MLKRVQLVFKERAKIFLVCNFVFLRPVNGDAEDVKGRDRGHVDVHRVVEVAHEGPKLPVA